MWLSYAQFEMTTGEDDCVKKSRDIYRKANQSFKESNESKEERMMILEAWRQHEVGIFLISVLLFGR